MTVRLERWDDPYRPEEARYRVYCRECNLRIDLRAPTEHVQRYSVDPFPIDAEQLFAADDDALSTLGYMREVEAEKVAQNARADRIEKDLEQRGRQALHRAGCLHAAERKETET